MSEIMYILNKDESIFVLHIGLDWIGLGEWG